MELNFNQNQIKIRKTIFNLNPQVEKSVKVARNVDSSLTQIQQMEALIKTLLRLEAIKINAYERWQPFFNEGLTFEGLLAFLNVFHNDLNFIKRLEIGFKDYKKMLSKVKLSKRRKTDLASNFQVCQENFLRLMWELREKIRELQIPIKANYRGQANSAQIQKKC